MEKLRHLPDVSTLVMDSKACVGCGTCEIVCPHGVFNVENRKAKIIDLDGCIECGACTTNCPSGALSVTPGVGCAAYIIRTWIKGKEAASCGKVECC